MYIQFKSQYPVMLIWKQKQPRHTYLMYGTANKASVTHFQSLFMQLSIMSTMGY